MSEEPAEKPRNVVLVGFMGAGKSSVGRRVADSLGLYFVDTDDLIVDRAGKPIPQIFADDGEEAFRDLETAVLEACADEDDGKVFSTGGGIVLRERNRDLLGRLGFVVWLRASEAGIWERVKNNRERPLLQTENPRETIRLMMADRDSLYEDACDIRIDTDDLDLDETAYGIVESARVVFGNAG